MAAINNNGSELDEHSPYSPDLTQSDFHLLPKLKKANSSTHFWSDDDGINAVIDFLNQ